MRGTIFAIISGAILASVATTASAAIVIFSSRTDFDAAVPGATVETFDSLAAGTTIPNASTVNGITFNSPAGAAVVTSSFLSTTGANSLGRSPIDYFEADDSITFGFGAGITAFGIDINTFAVNNGAYSATTSDGEVVTSFLNPFPGFTTGQFLGFTTTDAFTSLTLTGVSTTEPFTLDTLRFGTTVIPLPASLSLLLAAFGSFALFRRRAGRALA